MKKVVAILLALVMVFSLAAWTYAEETSDWSTAPVFTKAYEQSSGKIYIEWTGGAALYQIYVDGTKKADVTVSHHIIDLSKGTHTITIYPIYEQKKDVSTKIGVNVDVPIGGKVGDVVGGIGELLGGDGDSEGSGGSGGANINLDLDLAALGLDPKDLIPGTPSEPLNIDYKVDPIIDGVADNLVASIDFNNTVAISFSDHYNADEYEITIKQGSNSNYVIYRPGNAEDSKYLSRDNDKVYILLDPQFLAKQDCAAPKLETDYRFSVLMRKQARDYVKGEKIPSIIHSSKQSGELSYKPVALWKSAPQITFASQTADGEITLQWDHEDNGLGCEYAVMKINKALGVMTGEEQFGITKEHTFVIRDLNNGGYCINIVPLYNGEKGTYSKDANIDLKNNWVVAPALSCEQVDSKKVKLTWKAPANIEYYHITVLTGDINSVLRFVDLDYSKYNEFDVNAAEGDMEYIYEYDKDVDPVNGIKMKFEIYGVRHTESGAVQQSATSSQTIVVK